MNSTNTVGLTENTVKSLLINQGAIYKNYGLVSESLIGACSGANEFSVKIAMYHADVGGISPNVKGATFLKSIDATLKCNFIEMTEDILKMALIGKVDTTTSQDYDIITTNTYFNAADYIDNIALVGTLSGTDDPVVIILKNVLVTDGLSIKTENAKDNTLPVTFVAHIMPSSPKEAPYQIHYPKSNLPA